jgi:2-methylcitrate dehydratase PrpD
MPSYYANRLAEFVQGLSFQVLPADVIAKARVSVVDNVGLMLGGADSPAAKAILGTIASGGGGGTCTIAGERERVAPHAAALVNGTMCHSNDYTDTILLTVIHCGPVVVPAALAMAEHMELDGASTLLLVVLGYEVAARVSFAINAKPAMVHHRKGFHATSTCGVFGAAAIAARALGLDARQTADAFGNAGSAASGLIESITGPTGADTFRTHPGKAAHDGILAAFWAGNGLTGPHSVFEGRDGFLHAYSENDRYDAEALTDGLKSRFRILDVAIKYHNGTHAIASAVDSMQLILGQSAIDPKEVARIEAIVPSMHAYIGGNDPEGLYAPPTYSKAQMSLPFTLATAIRFGQVFVDEYTQERLHDPETLELARKVTVVADPEMDRMQNEGKWPARVRVLLANGQWREGSVDFPKGSPQNPFLHDELERKFRSLSKRRLDPRQQQELLDRIGALEREKSVRPIADLLAGA